MLLFDMEIWPYFFISWNTFIIGRIKEGLKADIVGSSFFGGKNFSFLMNNAYDVEILVWFIGERNVYGSW